MTSAATVTRFAPARRVEQQQLQNQLAYFSDASLSRHLLDALPNILLILNDARQIVYSNDALLKLIGAEESVSIHGLRFGEVLKCEEVEVSPGGCGTGEACEACGAVLATLAGLEGKNEVQECCLNRQVDGQLQALNLRVWSRPIEHNDEQFCVLALTDVSHEIRRRNLERIFFHDILNIAGSIRGFAEILQMNDFVDKEPIFGHIHATADRIIDEIKMQKTIAAAENHELQVQNKLVNSRQLLQKTQNIFRHHELAGNRQLLIDPDCADIYLMSDDLLIVRVLGNMVKNALEASAADETVIMGCVDEGGMAQFWVRNSAVISRERQLQVFRRNFSTKGMGRGLGTYCMKLLSGYLQGEVSFTSAEGEGTTFSLHLPVADM